jgi:hypothetical protein
MRVVVLSIHLPSISHRAGVVLFVVFNKRGWLNVSSKQLALISSHFHHHHHVVSTVFFVAFSRRLKSIIIIIIVVIIATTRG